MGGTIRCAVRTCGMEMTGRVCSCGNVTCYVDVYHNGKHWKYRRDRQGDVLTYGKAVKVLNAIREQIDSRVYDPAARLDSKVNERRFASKWEVYISDKEEQVRGNERSPSYVRILKCYRRKYFVSLDNYDVRDITLEQLAEVKRHMTGCKIKTKQNVINALSAFFNWLLDEDGSIVRRPKFPVIKGDDAQPQGAIDRFSQEGALAHIPEKYRDPIEFSMETGCRPGEVCALKVKDIDLADQKAHIRRTWSDYVLRETTKQKRKLWIPLSDRAVEIARINCSGKLPESFLFVNPNSGNAYRPRRLAEIWCEFSGTTVKLYEATRHSFCTQLVEDGVPLPIVQQLARHADIRTTQKYVHPTEESTRKAVNNRGLGKVIDLKSGTKAERENR